MKAFFHQDGTDPPPLWDKGAGVS